MKVPSLFHSNSFARGAVAVALASAMAATVAAVPLAANAAVTPTAIVSVATSVESSAVLAPPSLVASAAMAVPGVVVTLTPVTVRKPAAKKKKARKLTVRQRVVLAGRAKGLKKAEIKALLWICKHESNFHPSSRSRSGSYFGLFQLSKGMAHGRPWKSATWNTKRAIKYMRGRYHSVLKAKAHWLAHHWY